MQHALCSDCSLEGRGSALGVGVGRGVRVGGEGVGEVGPVCVCEDAVPLLLLL